MGGVAGAVVGGGGGVAVAAAAAAVAAAAGAGVLNSVAPDDVTVPAGITAIIVGLRVEKFQLVLMNPEQLAFDCPSDPQTFAVKSAFSAY